MHRAASPSPAAPRAARVVAALALMATHSVRGCSLGARPICYHEGERRTAPPAPWSDGAVTASPDGTPPPPTAGRMICTYPGAGPLAPPELQTA